MYAIIFLHAARWISLFAIRTKGVDVRRLALIISLVFLILVVLGCDCIRTYSFYGVVTDNLLVPLSGVEVRLYYRDFSGAYMSIGLTDNQGVYRAPLETMGAIEGDRVSFLKAGYQTTVVEPFNVSEAGRDICGSITLRRDAIMQPQ